MTLLAVILGISSPIENLVEKKSYARPRLAFARRQGNNVVLPVFRRDAIACNLRPMEQDDTKRHEKVDLRLPAGMRDLVRDMGGREHRSLNAQVVYYVESGLCGYGPKDIATELKALRIEVAEPKALLKNKKN